MKTIQREQPTSSEIEALRLDVSELLEVITQIVTNDSQVSLTIGDHFSDTRYVLENVEEIRSNLLLIEKPFILEVDSVRLSVTEYSASVSYDEDDSAKGRILEEYLKAHRFPFSFLAKGWSLAIIVGSVSLLVYEAYYSYTDSFQILPFILIYLITTTVVGIITFRIARPNISRRVKDGFFRRNKDKILLGIVMLVIGAAATEIIRYVKDEGVQSQNDKESVQN